MAYFIIHHLSNVALVSQFLSLVTTGSWAGTPGVDVFVQQLANADFTNYPTSFTRDIVPVRTTTHPVLTSPEGNSFT